MKFNEMNIGNVYEFDTLVVDFMIKNTVNQTPYYSLTITDGESKSDARIWDINMAKDLEKGVVYHVIAKVNEYAMKKQYIITRIEKSINANIENFYIFAPVEESVLRNTIFSYIDSISNDILKEIVYKLISDNNELFFKLPAGITMHHNYICGLAFHTYSMLLLSDSFCNNYKSINKDLLISGIILHDIGKTKELENYLTPNYSKIGNLLGHLVIGSIMVDEAAASFKTSDTEEVLALKHLIISHHGELAHGSPKQPLMLEAFALNFLDLVDSKLEPLSAEVSTTEKGTNTKNISTIERRSLYVPNIK